MKAKLVSKLEKVWKNPEGIDKKFFEVEVEGKDKNYSCWQHSQLLAVKIGDEIEFTETEKSPGRWSMVLAGAKAGGGMRGKSPEELRLQAKSFASAYSKDIAVICIEKEIIKSSVEIDSVIRHYFNLFSELMKE